MMHNGVFGIARGVKDLEPAAFHFLTEAAERVAYMRGLKMALRSGRHAIIGTFALDGPEWDDRFWTQG